MIFNRIGLDACKQTVTELTQVTEIAVELLMPEIKTGDIGNIGQLINVAATDTAAVNFLQGNDVIP